MIDGLIHLRVNPDRVQCAAPHSRPGLVIAGTQWEDSNTTTLARKVTCPRCLVPVAITIKRGTIFNGTGRRIPFSPYYECTGPDGKRFDNSSLKTLRDVLRRNYGKTVLTFEEM